MISALAKMIPERVARRLLPRGMALDLEISREHDRIESVETLACDASALRVLNEPLLREWLNRDLGAEWRAVEQKLSQAGFGSRSGAVNPGDQRAIYHLVRGLQPQSVLEVGTHVGASTSTLALALQKQSAPTGSPRLTTVDILDVNGPEGAWHRVGCSHPPAEVIKLIGCESFVRFVTQPSVPFLRSCKDKFDLIFLDGSHAAIDVYREIPAAVKLLNPGGLILLHDFFPDVRPLWSDGAVIAGPALAVRRLRAEHAPVVVTPLGSLPWPTKLGSNVTSLALLWRTGSVSAQGPGA